MWSSAESHAAHQRARFMQPDAARWMRPDAARWVRPDIGRFLAPGVRPEDAFPALSRKYNPNQPRVPKGDPDGGQWTNGGGGRGASLGSSASHPETKVPTDISSQSRARGHHNEPYAVFNKWNLPPETRKVFMDATTGKLANAWVRSGLDAPAYRHFWNGEDGPHGQYNKAVAELGERFLAENKIQPETMTPAQARALLREIDIAPDPRIRDFSRAMRLLRIVFRLRMGGRE